MQVLQEADDLRFMMKIDRCKFYIHGKHVYRYKGDKFTCACGKEVSYDVIEKDFK